MTLAPQNPQYFAPGSRGMPQQGHFETLAEVWIKLTVSVPLETHISIHLTETATSQLIGDL